MPSDTSHSPLATSHSPMGLGDILDETIRLYRMQPLVYIGIMVLGFAPLTILGTLALGYLGLRALAVPQIITTLPFVAEFAATIVGLGLLYFLAFLLTHGAATLVAAGGFLGEPTRLTAAFSAALRRVLALAGGTVLIVLVPILAAILDLALVIGLMVLDVLLGVAFVSVRLLLAAVLVGLYALSPRLRGRAIRVGAVLAMPLGLALYFGVRWSLFVQAVMLERMNPAAALSRSWQLVGGYWFRTLGFLVLLGVLVSVLQYVPGLLLGIPLGLFEALTQPEAVESGLPLTSIVANLSAVLGVFIFGAVQWMAMTIYYYDLRIRKEGYDLELQAQRLRQG